jgi:type I restriction enzyme M protein
MTGGFDLPALTKRVDAIQAETDLRPVDFADAALGLLFLTLADARFARVRGELEERRDDWTRRRTPRPVDYQARGAFFFSDGTTLAELLAAPGDEDLGDLLSTAVRRLGQDNPELRAVMNMDFRRLPNSALQELLKVCSTVKAAGELSAQEALSDFLTRYALDEDSSSASVGYTPSSIAALISAVLDLPRGRVFDPYCRGADLLVAVAGHARSQHHSAANLSLCGQTPTSSLARRAAMNLAAHRIDADIRTGRPLLDDPYGSVGKFDAAVVNPPFNENGPDPRSVDGDPRFTLGLPLTRDGKMKKANYLWIQAIRSALKPGGRGAILLPNSTADASASELVIRKRLIDAGEIEAVYSIGPNFYETGSNPVMLWLLRKPARPSDDAGHTLFVDARDIRTEIGRARAIWSSEQVEFLVNITRSCRGEKPEAKSGLGELMKERFPNGKYSDVAGLCKVASVQEIADQGWTLNPGRYVGVATSREADFDFRARLEEMNVRLEGLNTEAAVLQKRIAGTARSVLSGGED